jgi:lipopolysaccharide/colanic/teichoic acid biosynthesis glycosyltransferase
VLLAPVLLILFALTRLDGGPALYGHVRIGRNGMPFRCLKFRSMVTNGDAVLAAHLAKDRSAQLEWDSSRKLKDDPRVTRLGRVLRKTSLDELPQLFNVLSGEMSLVGPRPVVQAELTSYYGEDGQAAYLSVRPGITGLWQVSGRSNLAYNHRVALDMEYALKASLGMDAMILCRTVSVVVLGKGAR